jgi:hypothetical protein
VTYTVKTRGARGLMLAEYECPDHGLIERLVRRDENGDPPAVFYCTEKLCGDNTCSHDMCTCDRPSPHVMSAVHGRVKIAEVQRGKSDERPPWALNTEALADGMPMKEWRALQDKKDRDWRIKKNREALK